MGETGWRAVKLDASASHRIAAVVAGGLLRVSTRFTRRSRCCRCSRACFTRAAVAVSLTVTMASLGVAIAAPFAGILADRIGRRKVIVWSAFLLALSALATASATTLPQLIAWRFLQGVFTPGVFAVTVAYINDEWRDAGAGRAIAAYISGTVSGGFSSRIDFRVGGGSRGLAAGISGAGRLQPGSGRGDRGLVAAGKPPEEKLRAAMTTAGNRAPQLGRG